MAGKNSPKFSAYVLARSAMAHRRGVATFTWHPVRRDTHQGAGPQARR